MIKFLYLILLLTFFIVGCSKDTDNSSLSIDVSSVISVTECSSLDKTTSSETFNESTPSDVEDGKMHSYSNVSQNKVSKSKKQKKDMNVSSTDTVSVNVDNDKKEQNTEIESISSSSVPEQGTKQYATEDDTKIIAVKMIEYINKYREQQDSPNVTVLPGLTQYAEYRSNQLVTNFAHDTFDERAAATALKYGEYIDPKEFGSTGEPYYRSNAREAILMAGYSGTVDSVAERLALLTKNSAGHWNYVGGKEYKYIAIGVTYKNGIWYSDIAVSTENIDN